MKIVEVYEEKVSSNGDNWTSHEGYAVVEEISLYITEREEPADESDYWPKPAKWQTRMGDVLFYTSAGEYDGGYSACQSFIEGYNAARQLEPIKPSYVGSCA